jgi:hypothetical protein
MGAAFGSDLLQFFIGIGEGVELTPALGRFNVAAVSEAELFHREGYCQEKG